MKNYKVLEVNKENPYLSVIEKSGIKVEFTVDDIWDNIKKAKRNIETIKQELGIKKALMLNIENTHGIYIDIVTGKITLSDAIMKSSMEKFPEDAMTAIYLYREASGYAIMAEDKITELEVAIRDDERTMKEACELMNIGIPFDVEHKKAPTKEEKVDDIVNAPVAEEPKQDG